MTCTAVETWKLALKVIQKLAPKLDLKTKLLVKYKVLDSEKDLTGQDEFRRKLLELGRTWVKALKSSNDDSLREWKLFVKCQTSLERKAFWANWAGFIFYLVLFVLVFVFAILYFWFWP